MARRTSPAGQLSLARCLKHVLPYRLTLGKGIRANIECYFKGSHHSLDDNRRPLPI